LRRVRWADHVAYMGEMRNTHKIILRKPEGKRPLGRPRHRMEDSIRMDLGELEWEAWTEPIQNRDWWQAHEYSIEPLGVP